MVAVGQEHGGDFVVADYSLDGLFFETYRIDQDKPVRRPNGGAGAIRLTLGIVSVPNKEIAGNLMEVRNGLHRRTGSRTEILADDHFTIVPRRRLNSARPPAVQREFVLG